MPGVAELIFKLWSKQARLEWTEPFTLSTIKCIYDPHNTRAEDWIEFFTMFPRGVYKLPPNSLTTLRVLLGAVCVPAAELTGEYVLARLK